MRPWQFDLQSAKRGVGPLLRREYVGTIAGIDVPAGELIELLRREMPLLVDKKYARFDFHSVDKRPLGVGDEIGIQIRFAGRCRVRVSRIDDDCLTLHTAAGHPEAGRISFRAEALADGGGLRFRILSRARSATVIELVGYLALGMMMQTRLWVTLIERTAQALNGRLVGPVTVRTRPDRLRDDDALVSPHSTFTTRPG